MKLYFSKSACSLAVRILINELSLQAEYESVDLRSKQTATGKDFLSINPKGSVPVLEFKLSEVLTENSIILQYLCDTNNATALLPKVGDIQRYRVLEWLNYVATELHKSMGILFNPDVKQEWKDEVFLPIVYKKLDYVDNHLGNNKFLLGDAITVPDFYLFVILRWTHVFQINLNEWPNLTRYFQNMRIHKSVQKSLDEEE